MNYFSEEYRNSIDLDELEVYQSIVNWEKKLNEYEKKLRKINAALSINKNNSKLSAAKYLLISEIDCLKRVISILKSMEDF